MQKDNFVCYIKNKDVIFFKRSVITMDFSNKSVIITGAGNGIGRGIALHYAEKGPMLF